MADDLPIIIAGGGPCGLVAAVVLQTHGIPFKIVEKASRSKLCSNAGAGFDLAPTALKILRHRLGLSSVSLDEMMSTYERWHIATIHGEVVKDEETPQSARENYACAARAGVQKALLEHLSRNGKVNESAYLKCDASVESYNEEQDKVKALLSDGSLLVGKALLGCDGINSKVRTCMNEGKEDELHYQGTTCYWGKCPPEVVLQHEETKIFDEKTFVWLLGTTKFPGSFFVTPSSGKYLWILGMAVDAPKNTSNDLTRRGGGVLSETAKSNLLHSFKESGVPVAPILERVISATPSDQITEAGLFDRINLDLPYSSPGNLVALLGDSAHPQSPYLGQGANCAITDAYVLATNLAKVSVQEAVARYDSDERRAAMKKLVVDARKQGSSLNSGNWFMCWMLRTIFRFAPIEVDGLKKFDKSNDDMLRELEGAIETRSIGMGSKGTLLIVSVVVAALAIGARAYYGAISSLG